jgi:radical SAM superfamily enzyme YgiQ (UPF0313 family)
MTILTEEKLNTLLSRVRRPSRYINGEISAYNKPWGEAAVRWVLAFPDAYEVGMSHIGLEILYHIINKEPDFLADRVFTPWVDMETSIREEGVKLWGIESKHELRDFDVVGITLPYELTYTNILTILDLAGIPFYSSERGEDYPLIIGGGVGAFNPEPVADFFDAILLGDGEDAVLKISDVVREWKKSKNSKNSLIEKLILIEGVYIPSKNNQVKKSKINDLDKTFYPEKPIIPFMQVIHDRVGIEIQRGCARGCRFCQAGFIYRPVRQRSHENVTELSLKCLRNSGNEELSFLSLSAGDYDNLPNVMRTTNDGMKDLWFNISLPSLRVETLTRESLNIMQRSLHGGFTLAPEAATERLRSVINKGNSEEELLATIDRVFSLGWRQLKLYFMIGLPSETEEDVSAIADLAHKAASIGRRYRHDTTITVSVSTFIPKPHTPFQWMRQISLDETIAKQNLLKRLVSRRGIELKWHDARMSVMEGVFSRGDRVLSKVVMEAWKGGARFDAWDEMFRLDLWQKAFQDAGINLEDYCNREFRPDGALPWGHLFTDLDKEFLKDEYNRAIDAIITEDCMNGRCTKCGVCDFKEIKHRIYSSSASPLEGDLPAGQAVGRGEGKNINPIPSREGTINFTFTKLGIKKWLSHLELMQVFRRALRRSGLPIKYSQGFHPHLKFSFERALKVGEESPSENGKVEMTVSVDPKEFIERVNKELPDEIKILSTT